MERCIQPYSNLFGAQPVFTQTGEFLQGSRSKEKQLENDVSCIMLCEALPTFTLWNVKGAFYLANPQLRELTSLLDLNVSLFWDSLPAFLYTAIRFLSSNHGSACLSPH